MIAIWLLNDELKYVMAKKYGLDSLFTVFSSNSDDIEFILYFFLKISSIYQILVKELLKALIIFDCIQEFDSGLFERSGVCIP